MDDRAAALVAALSAVLRDVTASVVELTARPLRGQPYGTQDHTELVRLTALRDTLGGLRTGWRFVVNRHSFVRAYRVIDGELTQLSPLWAREWIDDADRAAIAVCREAMHDPGGASQLGSLVEARTIACGCGAAALVVAEASRGVDLRALCPTCRSLQPVATAPTNLMRATRRPAPEIPALWLTASQSARQLREDLAFCWRSTTSQYCTFVATSGVRFWADELVDDRYQALAELGAERIRPLADARRSRCDCGADAYAVNVEEADPAAVERDRYLDVPHWLCLACGRLERTPA